MGVTGSIFVCLGGGGLRNLSAISRTEVEAALLKAA